MNFFNLLVKSQKTYEFSCRESTDVLTKKIDKVILKVVDGKPSSTALSGPLTVPVTAPLSTPPSTNEQSLDAWVKKDSAIPTRGKWLKVRNRDKKDAHPVIMRFKVGAATGNFRKFFQPSIIGSVTDYGSSRDVKLEIQAPFLLKRLINWSTNIALFSAFGMVGSYFLIPDPAPLAVVLLKATVVPLIFAYALAWLCQSTIDYDCDRIANVLSHEINNLPPKTISGDRSSVISNVIFSKNTFITFSLLLSVLGGAMYLHNWAWNAWCEGNYNTSEKLCHHVLQLAEYALGKQSAGAAGCNYYIAECSRCQGNYTQAEEYYQKALSILESTINASSTNIADTIMNLGRVYEAQGKYEKAETNYNRALKIYLASPNFGEDCMWIGHLHNRIASLKLKMNKLKEADSENALALKIDRNYKWEAGRSVSEDLNDAGVIDARAGRWKQAAAALNESLTLKKSAPVASKYSLAVTLYNQSIVQQNLGKKAQASALKKQSEQLFKEFLHLKNDHSEIKQLYQQALQRTVQLYETPNADTRSELLYPDTGRI